ncbi:MAG TPA: DNA replication/repair protein RecF [Bacteroidota bacterium]|nr:DNA replication/repair protein RecF [Bacteroidota bacterium]
MHLTNLRLRHFRNHVDSSFQFGSGTNLLLGDNGEGKTNVLEAISYLCLTKSFYASSDALALGFGGEMFEVGGTFVSGGGSEHHIRVAYTRSPVVEKVVTVDRRHVEPFTSMIGRFPIVISSPEYAAIIAGAPMERRKFIDLVISQSSSAYLQHLIDYRKVLRHRNRILKEARIEGRDCSELLVPWDEQLIGSGSALTHRRAKFVREFQEFVSSSYHHLVGSAEEPAIDYKPMIRISGGSTEAEIGTMLEANLEQMRSIEMRAGVTLIGPQRDEIVFKINGLDVRDYASQGQQKTFLIALKMAEFFYLKDRSGETPILLLDDIFSELDEHRAKELLHFVEGLSQTFITSTTPRFFENGAAMDDSHKRFLIRKGAVIEEGVPV